MGKINIKLANNYIWNPQDAAANYFDQNKTITIAVPNDIKSLEISEVGNLQENFGCIGERESGGYWGLAVCYLKNQQAGFEVLWEKTQDVLVGNGEMPSGTRTIQKIATDTNIVAADITNQLFIDGAKKALANLNSLIVNKQDDWEIDFNVQFDPSSILGHDYKFSNQVDGLPYNGWGVGETQTSAQHGSDGRLIDNYIYSGAYGDKKAWMSGSNVSFFSAQARLEQNRDDLLKWQDSVFNDCNFEQLDNLNNQWEAIINAPE